MSDMIGTIIAILIVVGGVKDRFEHTALTNHAVVKSLILQGLRLPSLASVFDEEIWKARTRTACRRLDVLT